MELSGKIYKVMPIETGEGKNGTWSKQSIIIETPHERFPKKVCVIFWGDLTNNAAFIEGADISVEADVESRELNGRWYTDVKAWRINTSASNNTKSTSTATNTVVEQTTSESASVAEDDLPF